MFKKVKIALLLLMLLLAVGCESNQKPVVRIGYLPVVHALPTFYAYETGMFRKAGIEVELIPFQAPNQIIDGLLVGHIDIGAASSTATGITAIAHSRKPGALKIFSFAGSDETIVNDFLITQAASDIHSISELRGKRLGILPGVQWRTIATHMLAEHKLTPNEVTIVDVAPALQPTAILTGQIDALLSVEPARLIAMEHGAVRDIILQPVVKAIAPVLFAGCGVVSATFAKQNPELAKSIVAISKQAAIAVAKNPQAARPLLATYTPLTPELAERIDLTRAASAADLTALEHDSVQAFIDIFYQHGVIAKRVMLDELLYTTH